MAKCIFFFFFLSLAHKPLRAILELFSTTFSLAESRKVSVDAFSEIKAAENVCEYHQCHLVLVVRGEV